MSTDINTNNTTIENTYVFNSPLNPNVMNTGIKMTDSEIEAYIQESSNELDLNNSGEYEDIYTTQELETFESLSDRNSIITNKGLIPSNIPGTIDKLHTILNPDLKFETTPSNESIQPIIKLKNILTEDYSLVNYNGVCVDLDTRGKTLTIEQGSVLVAL